MIEYMATNSKEGDGEREDYHHRQHQCRHNSLFGWGRSITDTTEKPTVFPIEIESSFRLYNDNYYHSGIIIDDNNKAGITTSDVAIEEPPECYHHCGQKAGGLMISSFDLDDDDDDDDEDAITSSYDSIFGELRIPECFHCHDIMDAKHKYEWIDYYYHRLHHYGYGDSNNTTSGNSNNSNKNITEEKR